MDDDQKWMMRAQEGDYAAFDTLVRKYRKRVQVYCSSILHNDDDAKEEANETFTKAWNHRASYSPIKPVFHWLSVIAKNCCLNRLRGNKPTVSLEDAECATLENSTNSASSPEETVLTNAIWTIVRSQLTDELDQMICRWYYQLDWTPNEIAMCLKMNPETVRSRIKRRIKPAIKLAFEKLQSEEPSASENVVSYDYKADE